MRQDYLLEVGVEEMPARMVAAGVESLESRLLAEAAEQGLEPSAGRSWGTPRRLAVLLEGVRERQPDTVETFVGPPADRAYDKDGKPTKAAVGFARGRGVEVGDLKIVDTPRGGAVAATVERPGLDAGRVLEELVPRVIQSMSFPKLMRWGTHSVRFVRAIRNLLSLLGDQVVEFEIAGVRAGRESFGHRFAGSRRLTITRVANYQAALAAEHVVLAGDERRRLIAEALTTAGREVSGRVVDDPELLEEAAYLVEEPHLVKAQFDAAYLDLPREVLVTAMRHHQKSFPVEQGDGSLSGWFLNVVNMPDTQGHIARGYKRVLNARLADARFFWQEDRKRPLSSHQVELEKVVYLDRLGSYADKAARLEELTGELAAGLMPERAEELKKAAGLAKCDLATELVGEFAELQGVAGGLLLEAEGAPATMARAVGEHYRPESLERPSPSGREGALLSVADKLDHLVGPFLIGRLPTGTRDPFGLRRAAHGMVKVLLDHQLPVDLERMTERAAAAYGQRPGVQGDAAGLEALRSYLIERTAFVLQARGVAADVADAALAVRPMEPLDVEARARALIRLREEPALGLLVTIHKRLRNILAQAEPGDFNPAGLSEPAEQELAAAFDERAQDLDRSLNQGNYEKALRSLAGLAEPLHRFFEDVMVMVDDPALRANRTGLLARIRDALERFADFGRLTPSAD